MKNSIFNNNLILSLIVGAILGCSQPSVHADSAITNLKQTGKAFASIAKTVSPAIVNVQAEVSPELNSELDPGDELESPETEGLPPQLWDLFRNYDPGGQQRRPVNRQGSGFIISKDGYIVTNNHLVQNASKITVRLFDESEYAAKIIGIDPPSDLAVLKIDGKNLPFVTIGDSDAIEVGEWVVAIGNPFGLSHSLSAGVLSAKGRSSVGIADYENFLQTDAAINPGNSGGALLDLEGKVIGINTAIFSKTGGNMGIGFAIPINMAQTIIEQLKTSGKVVRGYLGVKIQELTKDLAQSFGLKERNAILVSQVEKDGPAEKSGLKQGDVITALDGKPVENIGSFRNSIASSKPTTSRKVDIIRDKKPMQLQVVIGTLDPTAVVAKETKSKDPEYFQDLNFAVQDITPDIAGKLGVKPNVGVVIAKVKPGSLAELAGLARGTVILEINQVKINNVAQFKAEYTKVSKSSNRVLLLVQDQLSNRYVALNLR